MAGAHGAGGALAIPNLSALVSSRSRSGAGAALGLKNSASGLGQFLGPLAGGSLIGVRTEIPFLVATMLLIGVAVAAAFGRAQLVLAAGRRHGAQRRLGRGVPRRGCSRTSDFSAAVDESGCVGRGKVPHSSGPVYVVRRTRVPYGRRMATGPDGWTMTA